MKFNKWTVALAAVGVVSLASAARADETDMSQVQTALSNTTLSGYVDTSIEWNPSDVDSVAPVAFQRLRIPAGTTGSSTRQYNYTKANGLDFKVVDWLSTSQKMKVLWDCRLSREIWFGPDATTFGTSGQKIFYSNGGALGKMLPFARLRHPAYASPQRD